MISFNVCGNADLVNDLSDRRFHIEFFRFGSCRGFFAADGAKIKNPFAENDRFHGLDKEVEGTGGFQLLTEDWRVKTGKNDEVRLFCKTSGVFIFSIISISV